MKKRELNQLNLLGGLCFVLGVLFALNSIDGFIGLTGNVISDGAYASLGSFFAIFFFLLGVLIFIGGRIMRPSELQRIVLTSDLPPVKQERDYGPVPQEVDTKQWVTLYHAAPRGKFRFGQNVPLTQKNAGKRGFYMSIDPVAATDELGNVDPADVEIHKVKIAKSIYDDLCLEESSSHMNAQTDAETDIITRKLSLDKLNLFNELYSKGYIKLGRGR